jgi:hypothetical protein
MFISNYACQQATPTNMDQPPSGGCHGHGGVILNSQVYLIILFNNK